MSDIELPPPPAMLGEQMSASSCRRVHSEILESVSKIKCSLLGRKGGLLHSYGNYGSDIALNEIVGSSGKHVLNYLTFISTLSTYQCKIS